jgi:signal transduction histidine kinase
MQQRRRDAMVDTAIAVVATIAAVWLFIVQLRSSQLDIAVPGPYGGRIVRAVEPGGQVFLVALCVPLTTMPLALRRRYPVGAFCLIMAAVLATHTDVTTVTFAAVLFAAYSAILYSPYRRLALLSVFTAAVIVTAAFPDTTPRVPARFTALLVLLPTAAVAVAMRTWRRRARIAGELHDVVTHNVSVMVVQAGAARSVLASSPGEARAALLAVEASGRTAMGELRHLLGLLAPAGDPGDEDAALVPQPGLDQTKALVDRVRAAGLGAELNIEGTRDLPPGVDLAAYRVVQEALTNVLKHASGAEALIRLVYGERELVITVTDDGGPAGYGARGAGSPGGRGLIGLRERVGLYGGELDAGPRPGGGGRVRASFPLEPA